MSKTSTKRETSISTLQGIEAAINRLAEAVEDQNRLLKSVRVIPPQESRVPPHISLGVVRPVQIYEH